MAGEYAGSRGVVIVDTTGTAVGTSGSTAGGAGSRVELLASGTFTNTASGAVIVSSTGLGGGTIADLPGWCHTIFFLAGFSALTGTPANWYVTIGGRSPTGGVMGSGTWIQSVLVASPTTASTAGLYVGRDAQTLTVSAFTPTGGGGALIGTGGILPRRYTITQIAGTPAATQSLAWEMYCYGG